MIWMIYFSDKYVTMFIIGLIILYQIYLLVQYVEQTNQKLTRFLESIKYSDFTGSFTRDSGLGSSFRELNNAFEEVINAFQKTRAEKEENLRYLHTVVQHVGIGLIAFDQSQKIELMNTAAKRLLGINHARFVKELSKASPELAALLPTIRANEHALIRLEQDNEKQLSIHATEFKMQGNHYRLVSVQNIQPELEQKELESWRNLTRVLRHEIMNSITPIASLSGTIKEMFDMDTRDMGEAVLMDKETMEDITDGLYTIQKRCNGLVHFVDAYRSFTTIPKPNFEQVSVRSLLARVVNLMKNDYRHTPMVIECQVQPDELEVHADPELIEMVLINLTKNAAEAMLQDSHPLIQLKAFPDAHNRIVVEVCDNGPGIVPEALDKIFIPFYTTKKTGSGIGLSWSRQIMNLHKGTLNVKSKPGQTVFTMRF
ncbi:Histidine kinase-, DNA gyrase B-, and HSP90-like ATPase [Catalinimonas alkaloidigena]|uniref:histidine kinase n=2 Tax=Catalinimonas alkaloidigena TaxID=1075417 RepID=A0A1G9BFV0_9BACT|nr:Histidine kinase-, DNA gyrase B-, and HSP90-like ATPase [Catalinimonas alkaloidigena]